MFRDLLVRVGIAICKSHTLLTFSDVKTDNFGISTFEKVPSDYAMLKIHTLPATGGDTVSYTINSHLPHFADIL